MISRQLALNSYEEQHTQKRSGQVPLVLDELSECIPNNDSGAEIGESVALSDALNRFIPLHSDGGTGREKVEFQMYALSIITLRDRTS